MNEPTKMTIAASYTLYDILNKIIFNDDQTERPLDFRVKYKLLRNRDLLSKDVSFFENERNQLIRQLGASDENGTIKVTDENMPQFQKELQNLLKIEVDHSLLKIKPEDIDNLENIDLDSKSLSLFAAAMIDDPSYEEDIKTPIEKEESVSSESNN